MDRKISEPSECKKQSKLRQQRTPPTSERVENNRAQASDTIPFPDFGQTPLEGLLALPPEDRLKYFLGHQARFSDPAQRGSSLDGQHFLSPLPVPSISINTSDPEYDCVHALHSCDGLSFDKRSTSSTYLSTTSLKRRLSRYSSLYVKAIARVVKGYSITDNFIATTFETAPCTSIDTEYALAVDALAIRDSSIAYSPRRRIPRLVLPDDLLVLDLHVERQGICLPGFKRHDSKTCWCLEGLYDSSEVWACRTGLINQQSTDPPTHLGSLDIKFHDIFGNTVLRIRQARISYTFFPAGTLPGAINDGSIFIFLQQLKCFHVNFQHCDLFGRSFFHLLTLQAREERKDAIDILRYFGFQPPYSRDAFGWAATWGAQDYDAKFGGNCRNSITDSQSGEIEDGYS